MKRTTSSVNSINSTDLVSRVKLAYDLNPVWEICHQKDQNPLKLTDDDDDDEYEEIIYRTDDLTMWMVRCPIVEIDLSATDEQIKIDFSRWLTNYRIWNDIKTNKKLITQADFDYWIQYGIIPYLDLVLIAKIEGKKITQNKMARLIYPNEYDVDIVGRVRQVTKPEAERLIKENIHRTLSIQIAHEKSGMKNA